MESSSKGNSPLQIDRHIFQQNNDFVSLHVIQLEDGLHSGDLVSHLGGEGFGQSN